LSTPTSHSVQARLLNYSRARQENHNHTLSRYAIERLMYRLSRSPHAGRFVLKGAMLFVLWLDDSHRPTKDLDLLGLGEFSADSLRAVFEEVCATAVEDDGVEFFKELIAIEEIREAEVYQGLRVQIIGSLGGIRLNVSVDVGFGDAVLPRPKEETFPALLDLPNPKLKTYPRETVVAEKLDAMVALGLRNSRMKDYYDLWTLARHFEFEGRLLTDAIKATLDRRGRRLQTAQLPGLEDTFAQTPGKQTQWKAFLRRTVPEQQDVALAEAVTTIRAFLTPVLTGILASKPLEEHWEPKRGWTSAGKCT
jgi:predicted nucleotidyltransferase component of viral defense system